MKNVKSTDPRKKAIVARMKLATKCRKITTIQEDDEFYYGNAMWGEKPGLIKLPKTEVEMRS